MDNDPKKSPYQGIFIKVIVLVLPPVVLTWLFYGVITRWQSWYSYELNWASAKALGCGLGGLFHLSCWISGAFRQDFRAVKERLKEFFENVSVSLGLAFTWYLRDVKTLGLAFWIDISVMAVNFVIFIDAVSKCIEIYLR